MYFDYLDETPYRYYKTKEGFVTWQDKPGKEFALEDLYIAPEYRGSMGRYDILRELFSVKDPMQYNTISIVLDNRFEHAYKMYDFLTKVGFTEYDTHGTEVFLRCPMPYFIQKLGENFVR